MAELRLHGQEVRSIFQLLGEHENDITYSVGWVLARSSSFLRRFVGELAHSSAAIGDVMIRLQQHENEGGITDIEIERLDDYFLIVEAKRGWALPTAEQLRRYASRPTFRRSRARTKTLIVVSECSPEYANQRLQDVNGVPVGYLSWRGLTELANRARSEGSHAEKRLVGQLLTYLRRIMTMQNLDSNWVYVVSLGSGFPEGGDISWIDIVTKRRRYFHTIVGGGWPKEPPNYIGFRYQGKLQSIHHIEDYEVVTDMHARIPEIPEGTWEPHHLYTLGPAFGPSKEVHTGRIYRNGRVWCMLDTLFTFDTISEARDASQRRQE